MKVIAYYPLHYGIEYLDASIRSIAPLVDKIMIFYSEKSTHGVQHNLTCPENREDLYKIAMAASDKVEWVDGYWGIESQHRAEIWKYADGYDVVLAVDADEVWNTEYLAAALDHVMRTNLRYFGVAGYLNFWRSFEWVCTDGFRPVRFIRTSIPSGQGEVTGTVYHFSTCQRREIMEYKYKVFGHASEMRTNWLEEVYYRWKSEADNAIPLGLHPVSYNLWGAVAFDKHTLPDVLKDHPNFNKMLV